MCACVCVCVPCVHVDTYVHTYVTSAWCNYPGISASHNSKAESGKTRVSGPILRRREGGREGSGGGLPSLGSRTGRGGGRGRMGEMENLIGRMRPAGRNGDRKRREDDMTRRFADLLRTSGRIARVSFFPFPSAAPPPPLSFTCQVVRRPSVGKGIGGRTRTPTGTRHNRIPIVPSVRLERTLSANLMTQCVIVACARARARKNGSVTRGCLASTLTSHARSNQRSVLTENFGAISHDEGN